MIKKSLPNILTVSRVLIIPLIIVAFYLKNDTSSFIIIGLLSFAGITDFFDGYLARIWRASSKFGKLCDPIADKLIIITLSIMMIYDSTIEGYHVIAVIIIICREVYVSGLREFLGSYQVNLPVSAAGKIKTTLQFASLIVILIAHKMYPANVSFKALGELLLWIAAVVSLWSAIEYSCHFLKIERSKD